MNTHYAITIGDSYDMTLIGAGSKEQCEEMLTTWLRKQPLSRYGTAEIVARDASTVRQRPLMRCVDCGSAADVDEHGDLFCINASDASHQKALSELFGSEPLIRFVEET